MNSSNKVLFNLVTLILIAAVNLLGVTNALAEPIDFIFKPIIFFSASAGDDLGESVSSIVNIGELRKENADLKIENATLKSENDSHKLMLEKIALLEEELQIEEREKSLLLAQVLGDGVLGVADYIIVNKGELDGVMVGDVVRVGENFVGRVDSTLSSSSRVLLPTSKRSSLEALIFPKGVDESAIAGRDGFSGLAVGSSNGVSIQNVPNNPILEGGALIFINDERVGQILYLGDVTDVKLEASSPQVTLLVKPPISYHELNYVMIVTE